MNHLPRVTDRPARISCAATAAPGAAMAKTKKIRHERTNPTTARRPAGCHPPV